MQATVYRRRTLQGVCVRAITVVGCDEDSTRFRSALQPRGIGRAIAPRRPPPPCAERNARESGWRFSGKVLGGWGISPTRVRGARQQRVGSVERLDPLKEMEGPTVLQQVDPRSARISRTMVAPVETPNAEPSGDAYMPRLEPDGDATSRLASWRRRSDRGEKLPKGYDIHMAGSCAFFSNPLEDSRPFHEKGVQNENGS